MPNHRDATLSRRTPKRVGSAATPLALVCLILASAGWAGPARAAGLHAPMVGSAWSSGVTGDAAAVYWNPAMLGALEEDELLGSLSVVYLHLAYQRERLATYQHEDGLTFAEPLDPRDVDPDKTGQASEVEAHQFLPTGGGFGAFRLSDDVVVGGGLYAPYGAILNLDRNGPQRWSLQSVTLLAVYATPSVSVRLADWVTVGVSGGLVVGHLAIDKVADLAGTSLMAEALGEPPISQPNDFGPAAPPSVRELDTMSRPVRIHDAYAFSGTFIAGAAFHPSPQWTIGLTYEFGTPLTFKGDFELDMSPDFFTTDLASQGLRYPSRVDGTAWVELTLPHIVRLGARYAPDETWDLRLQAEWIGYSATEAFGVTLRSEELEQPALGLPDTAKLDIPRRWNDVFTVEGMFSHQIGESFRLGARLGYHSPFSPDSTVDVGSPDGHRVRMTLLAKMALLDSLELLGEVDVQFIVPRTVRASDYDLANGTYGLVLVNAGGALRYRF